MSTLTNNRIRRWFFIGSMAVLLTAVFSLAIPGYAQTDPKGSVVITAGSLSMTTPTDPEFTEVTLNGTNQTTTASSTIGVKDFTGSGAGWNLQITSTSFDSGTHRLADNATTITSVSTGCATANPCTAPSNSIAYPQTVPAGVEAPSPLKFFNAAVDSGLGDMEITTSFELAVPATTYAGEYESTMMITLASAP